MAKSIRINNLDDECTHAINMKRAELILQNKDYKKPDVIIEIIKEWRRTKMMKPVTLSGRTKDPS